VIAIDLSPIYDDLRSARFLAFVNAAVLSFLVEFSSTAKDRPSSSPQNGTSNMPAKSLVALAVVGVAVVAVAGGLWASSHPEIAPAAPPKAGTFDRKLVSRGEALAGLGACAVCHTREGGEPFAGGLPLATPFGTLYTTNITPDAGTGIGAWTKEAFTRAMREGVDRRGNHLYPAFPYDHFTRVSTEDLEAIYAYLMSGVSPVAYRAPENQMNFPWNIRRGIAAWNLLFLERGPLKPDATKDAEWNRGAYLAEGLGHCGSCHSPRNAMGAIKKGDDAYGGAHIEGWTAPALNKSSPAPIPWTKNAIVDYLMDGWHQQHGIAAGTMTPVVNNLRDQKEDDVFAIATYILSLQGGPLKPDEQAAREQKAKAFADKVEWNPSAAPEPSSDPQLAEGARVFQARCTECHRVGSKSVPLALASQVNLPDPSNLARVIVHGIRPPQGSLGRSMPAQGGNISDSEMVALIRFVRARFSTQQPWSDIEGAVQSARAHK
jgi:mono/diheme cytochrome c family protein